MASTFHNTTTADLADEFGALKGQVDAIEERLSAIKKEMLARQVERVEGQRFTVTISSQTTKRLDTKALKAALGDDIIAEFEKETTSQVVRTKPTVVFGQSVAE